MHNCAMKSSPALALIACAFLPWTALSFAAGDTVQPPCGAPSVPAYPRLDLPPAISVVHRDELVAGNWRSPPCTGWPESFSPSRVVALAGSFRFDGDLSALVARLGSVSALRGVQYWSATEKRWRPLVYDAAALASPDPNARRGDFTLDEMTAGTRLYYWVNDSRFGPVTYEQTVLARGEERASIATRNMTRVTFFFATLFAPGELRTAVFIEKISPGVWGMYLMLGASGGGWPLDGGDASFVNRAVALYRQAAGIPSDMEPPAIR
jgi:hypothetical protein